MTYLVAHSTTVDGKRLKLIASQTVLLLHKNAPVEFRVSHKEEIWFEPLEYVWIFLFSDEGEPLTSHLMPILSGGKIIGQQWVLHGWMAPSYVEVSEPVAIDVQMSKGESKRLWLKFRTQAAEGLAHRQFVFTLWIEE